MAETRAGVLWSRCNSIQGSHTLSRYGDWKDSNLTLGITRGTPAYAGRASPI